MSRLAAGGVVVVVGWVGTACCRELERVLGTPLVVQGEMPGEVLGKRLRLTPGGWGSGSVLPRIGVCQCATNQQGDTC